MTLGADVIDAIVVKFGATSTGVAGRVLGSAGGRRKPGGSGAASRSTVGAGGGGGGGGGAGPALVGTDEGGAASSFSSSESIGGNISIGKGCKAEVLLEVIFSRPRTLGPN